MYEAIVYFIEGPRSLSEAVKNFNNMDHSSKIYDKMSSVSCYVKAKLGKDFATAALMEAKGVGIKDQVVKTTDTRLDIHIPLLRNAPGKRFNAILIVDHDVEFNLRRPLYMISCEDQIIGNHKEHPYINITIPLARLKKG